jgi:hypothetical protein
MSKEEILQEIKNCFNTEKIKKSRNYMGVSESFYNSYYLVGRCFIDGSENRDAVIDIEKSDLFKMSDDELNNLIKLAEFASEAFY